METRRLNILQLQVADGASTSDLGEQIIRALPVEQYRVTNLFLCGDESPVGVVSRADEVIYLKLSHSALRGLRLRAMWWLFRHCRSRGYDAVIAHRFKCVNMMLMLDRWLRLKGGIGIAHGFGEYDRRYRRLETRWFMPGQWRFVGVSTAVRDYLLSAGAGFSSGNTLAINNAIDIDRAEATQRSREDARSALGLPSSAFIFGAIGRLVPIKGHVYLLRALAKLQIGPNVLVAIIGEGRARGDLEREAARLGIQKQVILLGAKDEALQYVRAFDCLVMPSHSEGLPLALLEGMTGQLPVMGSDIPSMRPILDGCGGRYFPVGDVEQLAGKMREVLELSSEQRAQEGALGYAYLRREHDIVAFQQQYRALLDRMLGVPGHV